MNESKIILITGASSGMGKDAALALLKEGHVVYGAARRVEKMKELVSEGGHAIKLDVTESEEVRQGVDRVMKEQGRIDVLVNNAGYGLYGSVEDVSMEEARHQFEVNIFGLAQITKEVLPHMRHQKSGKIINISSMGGRIYTPLGSWYHATKHALEGWSDCLRLELKQFGIDVVVIQPGVIETEFGDVLMEPLLERSKNSPYRDLAEKVAKATGETYANGKASDPAVITKLILKAINSKNPRTRYSAGKFAKPMMLIRKYLGDSVFDSAVMSQVR
jgi:short-subunit dehydrogenase